MPTRLTLTKEMEKELDLLADTLGFTREAAMYYAVRLVNACVREGLLTLEHGSKRYYDSGKTE